MTPDPAGRSELPAAGAELDALVDAAADVTSAPALDALLDTHPELLRAFRQDGWSALHLAAFYARPHTVVLLLARGADTALRSTNATANTPLHAAIAGTIHHDVIRELLDGGSDVNATGGHDVTPLHLAAARGDRVVTDLLLARGADPRARMDDGSMPVHMAAERGHESLTLWLEGKAAP